MLGDAPVERRFELGEHPHLLPAGLQGVEVGEDLVAPAHEGSAEGLELGQDRFILSQGLQDDVAMRMVLRFFGCQHVFRHAGHQDRPVTPRQACGAGLLAPFVSGFFA